MPQGVAIYTPVPSEMDTLQTDNLPWFQFIAFLECPGNVKWVLCFGL